MVWLGRLMAAMAMVALTAGSAAAAMVTISGEVTYRERIALPENGRLRIQLVAIDRPDQPRVQAEALISTPGQVPLSFSLNLDDRVLAEGTPFGIVAEIISNGQVWFRNSDPVPVDTAALDAVTILVNFTDRTPDPEAPPPADPTPMLDVSWSAEEIAGVPADPALSTLTIASDRRAGGRGGCNSYFSQAQITGEGLVFSAPAATRMACDDISMAQEALFFEALGATRFWRLVDGKLHLLDASGTVVARLARTVR